MSDDPLSQNVLDQIIAGLIAFFAAVQGFMASKIWNSSEKISVLAQEVRDLRLTVERWHEDEKFSRRELIARLDRIEFRNRTIDNGRKPE